MSCFLLIVVSFACGAICGWTRAHYAILSECKKIGTFFVNNEIVHVDRIEIYDPDVAEEK